jgi:hypothetical protein
MFSGDSSWMMLRRAAPVLLLLGAGAVSAQPGHVRTLNGVAFYEGDPGPVTDTFWTSGQYRYDPHGYMDINRWDTGIHVNTVYGPHSGAANCVFRKRVVIDDWDRRHSFLRVCRRAE